MQNKFNFTKATLDGLPIPSAGHREIYHDAKVPGLQLRVTTAGSKTFSVFKRIKGSQPERVTLGRYPAMTIEQARIQATKIIAAIESGSNPAQAKRAHKAELTFDDLFNEFVERHAKLRKRTWKDDVVRYELHIKPRLGKKKLSQITRADVADVHSALTKAGHSTNANRILALVSVVFNKGITWGRVEANPAFRVEKNPEWQRDRFLQVDELPKFFEAVLEEPNTTLRDFFLMAIFTGARRSNVLAMQWDQVNVEERIWRIPRTKNGTPQNVTLSPEAMMVLESRRKQDDSTFVFPGPGKAGHLTDPKKGWKRVLEKTGFGDLRIHDLRRTMGSWQARTGASLLVIGKSLNHLSSQSTAIYARLDLDPVREAVNTANSAIRESGRIDLANMKMVDQEERRAAA